MSTMREQARQQAVLLTLIVTLHEMVLHISLLTAQAPTGQVKPAAQGTQHMVPSQMAGL